MPLALPDLDSLAWTDLVEEARSTIASSRLEWTDFNVSDPGVTIVELLAWLVEQRGYRLNRVPERHRRKFLSLVGVVAGPPRAARAVVGATLDRGWAPVALPAGSALAAETAGGDVRFVTDADALATSTAVVALATADAAGAQDLTPAWRGGRPVAPWGDDPAAGAALLVGLDPPPPPGSPFALWLELGDGAAAGRATREALVEEGEEHLRECGGPAPSWVSPERHHSVRVEWQVHTAAGWTTLDAARAEVADGTRGLSLAGMVRVTPPAELVALPVAGVACHLRARLVAGRPDVAPRLHGLVANAVAATQVSAEHRDREIGFGTGLPGQSIALEGTAVADGAVAVTVGAEGWRTRPDLDGSGRDDRHLALDVAARVLVAGDGRRGRTIPRGSRVGASYRVTEGALGNVAGGLRWRLLDRPPAPPEIVPACPFGASGGADAETTASAARRAAEELWAHERLVELAEEADAATLDAVDRAAVRARRAPARAVTVLDHERLALAVPGTDVRRARAFAAIDPALPCAEAEGTVTLIIVPSLPLVRPAPSACLLRAVSGFLARRRLVGTRLLVVGPTYVEVGVGARVAVRPRRSPEEVVDAVGEALRRHLHPLTGGPAGTGWPFGRDVRASELVQVVDAVDGVDHVVALEVTGPGATACGDVCIAPTALPWLDEPRVEADV